MDKQRFKNIGADENSNCRYFIFLMGLVFIGIIFSLLNSSAHESGPLGWAISDWHNDQIQQVRSVLSESAKDSGGKQCFSSPYIIFDVNDSYAFDIDETVDLSFDIDLSYQGKLTLGQP